MATTTTNLSLIKPDGTDKIRINQLNQNFDILDRVVGPVGNTSLQAQLNPIAAKVAYLDKLIENGTDLNSLMNTGVYRSPSVAAGVNTLLNCPVEVPFVMVVSGTGELTGCVQLLCSGTQLYCRRATSSGFPESWSSPTGGEGGGGSESEYTIDDLYEAIDTAMAGTKAEIVSELIDDTTGEGDTDATWSSNKIATAIATMQALLDTAAHVDGEYDNFVAGNAKQLVSKVAVEDNAPYNFRTAGGAADIGDRMTDKLIGGTVAWNQLLDKSRFSESGTYNGIAFTNNGDGSVTISGTASDRAVFSLHGVFATKGHVYLLDPSVDVSGVWIGNSTWGANGKIFKQTSTSANAGINVMVASGTAITGSIKLYPNIFDLTQMFGENIAEYIRTLESATAGAGVAWFRKLFPKPYYDYNAVELMSVQAASHNTVGFNAWDEEWELGTFNETTGAKALGTVSIRSKNYIPVIPGAKYNFKSPWSGRKLFYDANKNFLSISNIVNGIVFTVPKNAHFMMFRSGSGTTTYENNVCINLSWDGERDGEYEPYSKHEYSLGNVELRGALKLDVNNNLYYDGDEYENNGTVTRKYKAITLDGVTNSRKIGGCTAHGTTGLYFCTINLEATEYGINSSADYPGIIADTFIGQSGVAIGNIYVTNSGKTIVLVLPDQTITTTASANQWLSSHNVNCVYELATPTTETSDPFQDPQVVDDFGTEEYVDRGVTATTPTRDVSIPVGHETKYQVNLRAKLEMAPNSPVFGDGDYVVRQVSGQNEYVKWENSRIAEALARKDGDYDELVAGTSKQLASNVGVLDKEPYNFRTAGGSADIGDRMTDKLVGGTIAWNQMVVDANFNGSHRPSGSTRTYDSTTDSITISGTTDENLYAYVAKNQADIAKIVGHVYLISAVVETENTGNVWFKPESYTSTPQGQTYTGKKVYSFIQKVTGNSQGVAGATLLGFTLGAQGVSFSIKFSKVNMFDLTNMFGSTIAEYISTLESATAGAGVAWFCKLFPKPYYSYDAGTLMSVQAASHNTVGFNAWDEAWEVGGYDTNTGAKVTVSNRIRSTNKVAVVPNMTYYFNFPSGASGNIFFYDASGAFIKRTNFASKGTFTTPENCTLIAIAMATDYGTTYRNDICINLHWDGERDGEYEPYVKRSYPLGNVELRGIPKLDSNNSLCYDGDEYESNGTVMRKYGIIDLGSLTWSRSNSDTSHFYADVKNAIDYKFANDTKMMCAKYKFDTYGTSGTSVNHHYYGGNGTLRYYYTTQSSTARELYISDNGTYADAAAFKAALSGVYLVYELATPTTESSDPFQDPQIVDDWGTEAYVDREAEYVDPDAEVFIGFVRDVAVPVGHETKYQPNLRAKLEMAPDSPDDGNGDYVVRHTNGVNEYVKLVIPNELPSVPETNGTYVLKVTVANGTPTLSWVQST